jgi:hypothetical protein
LFLLAVPRVPYRHITTRPSSRLHVSSLITLVVQALERDRGMLQWEWEQFKQDRARFDAEVAASRRERKLVITSATPGGTAGPGGRLSLLCAPAWEGGGGRILLPDCRASQWHTCAFIRHDCSWLMAYNKNPNNNNNNNMCTVFTQCHTPACAHVQAACLCLVDMLCSMQ